MYESYPSLMHVDAHGNARVRQSQKSHHNAKMFDEIRDHQKLSFVIPPVEMLMLDAIVRLTGSTAVMGVW
jgi:hypothetical protein